MPAPGADLEAVVFKMLVEIADRGEAYEEKNGRPQFTILNRAARLRAFLLRFQRVQ